MVFWVGRTFDRPVKAMDITVVASSLVGFVLSHQRNQFLGGPALGLKVIVVRSRCTGIHLSNTLAMSKPAHGTFTYHEVDGRTSAKDVSTRHHGTTSTQPFGGSRVVE
jgi:hypothetical protein